MMQLTLFLTIIAAGAAAQSAPSGILFVCEHGSAKSVIAAGHFNRLAAARKLPVRAFGRGIDPDAEIPAIIRIGMLADGLDVSGLKPETVTLREIQNARRVITLGCELPASKSVAAAKLEQWNDIPPVGSGYEAARRAIVEHIDQLLKSLAGRTAP